MRVTHINNGIKRNTTEYPHQKKAKKSFYSFQRITHLYNQRGANPTNKQSHHDVENAGDTELPAIFLLLLSRTHPHLWTNGIIQGKLTQGIFVDAVTAIWGILAATNLKVTSVGAFKRPSSDEYAGQFYLPLG